MNRSTRADKGFSNPLKTVGFFRHIPARFDGNTQEHQDITPINGTNAT